MSLISQAYTTLAASRTDDDVTAQPHFDASQRLANWYSPSPTPSGKSSAYSSVSVSADESEENEDNGERGIVSFKVGGGNLRSTTARRRKTRPRRYATSRDKVKVLDGIKDGYNLGFRKKCVECCLIIGLLAIAVRHNLPTVLDNLSFVLVCSSILVAVLYVQRGYWSMPSVLYIYLFPTALTLADYPQYLRLNLLLSVCSLPLPAAVLSNIAIILQPSNPAIYYLHSSMTSIVGTLTTTSLSPTETLLAGTLLVNLLLNAKSMDMIFLRAFMFGSLFSLWPSMPLVKKVMKISLLPRHRRPKNSGKKKLIYACAVYAIFVVNVLFFVRLHLSKQLGQDPFAYMVK